VSDARLRVRLAEDRRGALAERQGALQGRGPWSGQRSTPQARARVDQDPEQPGAGGERLGDDAPGAAFSPKFRVQQRAADTLREASSSAWATPKSVSTAPRPAATGALAGVMSRARPGRAKRLRTPFANVGTRRP
jgi:hypothetical protein